MLSGDFKCIVLLVLMVMFIGGCISERQAQEGLSVGYKIHEFEYQLKDGSAKSLTIAIWYPTPDALEKYDYNRIAIGGSVAVNGAVKDGSYPLVVFSHGFDGCGTQSVYFTQYLAGRGYIVAAPEHEDAGLCSIMGGIKKIRGSEGVKGSSSRAADVSAVIDEMLRMDKGKASFLYGSVDDNAIAVSGHSMGGWTSLAVAGAINEYKDDRIKAVLLLAPNVNQFFPGELERVDVPAMFILGGEDLYHISGDKSIPRKIGYDSVGTPKYLLVVKGVNHFGFADAPTCLLEGTLENCWNSNERVKVVLKYSIAFLDKYLKGIDSGQLNVRDSLLEDFEVEE